MRERERESGQYVVKQVEITVFYISGQKEDRNCARDATMSFNSRRYGEENWCFKL